MANRKVCTALGVLALVCLPVAAQQEIEEIVVTGSYIRGTPEDAASPVEVLSRDNIVASGVTDISEIARNLDIASGQPQPSYCSTVNACRLPGKKSQTAIGLSTSTPSQSLWLSA
jgi:iron complex outermembrane receptor protein